MSGTAEKIRLVKIIIIKQTATHREPTIGQNFTNTVLLKYNNSAMKIFYRQRNGGLENLSHFFFITIK